MTKSLSRSQSRTDIEMQERHHEPGDQETQIPLYFSVVKEKARRKTLNLRSRIKDKFKRKGSTSQQGGISEIDTSDLTADHSITLEELSEKYNTHINYTDLKHSMGLTGTEAAERLERDGPNSLTPTKPIPQWVKFLKQFTSLFPIMLETGGILSFIAYGIDPKTGSDNLYLGIILWAVVIVTATFTFLQESKSAHVMESFRKMAPSSTKVVRDSHLNEIGSENLVVGDVIHVKAGDKVPADVRVIQANHFKVDNSSLTGESEPQSRTAQCTDQNPLETSNLAFYSTLAVDGECVGVVVATGDNTTIGKIAKLASKTKPSPTPLKREIETFIKIITIVAICLGAALLTVGFATKVKWIYVIIFCIGVVVAQVPEGLLPTITVALTLTAKRMSRKNVLVKNLLAVETFGSTKTIASDKTGTLTQNIMTVVHLWYDATVYSCDASSTTNYYNEDSKTFKNLFRVAALCNKTVFDRSDPDFDEKPIQQRKTIGDASESALLKFCENVQNVEAYRNKFPKVFEIPFNSVNKWQLSIHRDEETQSLFLVMKGAPERIIKICSKIMIEGEEVTLDEKYQNDFQNAYEFLAGKGERALGLAMLPLNPEIYTKNYQFDIDEKNFPTDDLIFIGLTTLMDPPRPSVPDAIVKCKSAGVRVMMVTGDHPITATSIAKQVGIIEAGETLNDIAKRENIDILDMDFSRAKAIVIPGSRLDELTENQWDRILSLQQVVFARTSPEQKLIIVEQCQLRGDIVAVTGDGVNDSPALKKADLGCAMGITGSEVAKEAAAIVLLDDNFASIVSGIEEGRMIFDKLKKSICYTLSSNIPELVPFLLFFLLKMPTALSGILILCIDLGTDLVPVISYAYEHPETDIMNRPPRDIKKERLVSLKLAIFSYIWLGSVQCAAGFLNYFMLFNHYGISPHDIFWTSSKYFMIDHAEPFKGYNSDQQKDILKEAQTAYFVAVVLVRLGAALSCKTRKLSIFQHGFKNWVFNFGVLSMLGVVLFIVHVPGVRSFFGTTIIPYRYWLMPIPFALFLVAMNELRLFFIRATPGEAVYGEALEDRQKSLVHFTGLGPPDLCVLVKSYDPPRFVPGLKPQKLSSFHWVSGVDTSSTSSIAVYLGTLVENQEKSSFGRGTYKIEGCHFCAYNAFLKMDLHVEIGINNSTPSVYSVGLSGERNTVEESFWKETYISSMLRAILPPPPFLRPIKSIPCLKGASEEADFLKLCSQHFWQDGFEVDDSNNLLVTTLSLFFIGRNRLEPMISFFEEFKKTEPSVAVVIAKAMVLMGNDNEAIELLESTLTSAPESTSILMGLSEAIYALAKRESNQEKVDQLLLRSLKVILKSISLKPLLVKGWKIASKVLAELGHIEWDEELEFDEEAGDEFLKCLTSVSLAGESLEIFGMLVAIYKKIGWVKLAEKKTQVLDQIAYITRGKQRKARDNTVEANGVQMASGMRHSKDGHNTTSPVNKSQATENTTETEGSETSEKQPLPELNIPKEGLWREEDVTSEGSEIEDDEKDIDQSSTTTTASTDTTNEESAVKPRPVRPVFEENYTTLDSINSILESFVDHFGLDSIKEVSKKEYLDIDMESFKAKLPVVEIHRNVELAFHALFQDVKAYQSWKEEEETKKLDITQMSMKHSNPTRSYGDWVRLGRLSYRLGELGDAEKLFKLSTQDRFFHPKPITGLVKIFENVGDIRNCIMSSSSLSKYYTDKLKCHETNPIVEKAILNLIANFGLQKVRTIHSSIQDLSPIIGSLYLDSVKWRSYGFDK
eukprot:gene8370-9837_t